MDATARQSVVPVLDREEAQAEWLRALPAEVRRSLLRPKDVARLLERVGGLLAGAGPDVLTDLKEEVYRLARSIQERAGHEAALRYLRDGMAAALLPCVRQSPECAETATRIILKISDAVWEAHANSLEQDIRLQHLERMHQELMLAKRIQERLLPRAIPQVPGFDIAGKVLPAAEVGGDYWSCKNYPEDGVVTLKLADVTGHGIAAATLVAAVKFISGGYYRGSRSAAEVMSRTNHVLVKETPNEILVTMVYGWLYPATRELVVVNAGHSPVWHYHGGILRHVPPTGLALGMIETRYGEVRLPMDPGDIFFTCSDGVTDPFADALGEEWVQELLKACAHLCARDLVDHVLEEALAVYGAPHDDMSVLAVKRTG